MCCETSDDLWKRWSYQYLTFLRNHNWKDHPKGNWPSVGKILLIHDEGPCVFWKLGIVTKLLVEMMVIFGWLS